MNTEDITTAIRAVYRGSAHLAPGVIDSLAKNIQIKATPSPTPSQTPDKKKIKPEQLLFKYGDWATVVLAVGVLSQLRGTGHHLGHAGLFFLMLALIARSMLAFSTLKKWRSLTLTRVGFLQSGRIRKSKIAERIEGIGK